MCWGRRFSIGFLVGRSSLVDPTRNLFFEGMKIRNTCPSLTISKMSVETTGAWPMTRIMAGRFARMKPADVVILLDHAAIGRAGHRAHAHRRIQAAHRARLRVIRRDELRLRWPRAPGRTLAGATACLWLMAQPATTAQRTASAASRNSSPVFQCLSPKANDRIKLTARLRKRQTPRQKSATAAKPGA